MRIAQMAIPDAYHLVPDPLPDNRGRFHEAFRASALSAATGHPFTAVQANYSVSRRGTLRGLHGTVLPPGQSKIVTCLRGAIQDVVVDLRVGSPTFGMNEVTTLDANSASAVFLADGLGHAFLALTDDACVGYLCSTEYVPNTMIDINPLDPDLDLPWDLSTTPALSRKDSAAPTLAETVRMGVLPTYQECLAYYTELRQGLSAQSGSRSSVLPAVP